MQLKYSNYVAFSHDHGFAVNNSGLFVHLFARLFVHLFVQLFVHLFVHLFAHLFVHFCTFATFAFLIVSSQQFPFAILLYNKFSA